MQLLSHIDFAHMLWLKHLRLGYNAIDATCGRGKDSLLIAKAILSEDAGNLFCLDIQSTALDTTKCFLQEGLSPLQFQRVHLLQQSHCHFPEPTKAIPIHLIAYNLGYLPGGDKSITTLTPTTILSLENALALIVKDGLISVTCYPGHEEGQNEYQKIILWAKNLDPRLYKSTHFHSLSHPTAPACIFITKN